MEPTADGGAPACGRCGEKGNRAEAKFCLNCGGSLAPEPERCPKCGDPAATPGAKFCNSCGGPMAAEAAFEPLVAAVEPEPKRHSRGVLWVVLMLALAGGGAFAYLKFLRIPEPRLIVWSGEAKDLEVQVQSVAAVPRDAQGGYSPAPGPCVVTVSRMGKPIETHRFTILPGAVHVCAVGGAPVEAVVDGLHLGLSHPRAGALFACEECRRLNTASRCDGCKKDRQPLSSKRTLRVVPSDALAEGTSLERALILVNPYAADLTVSATTSANSVTFPLPRESTRAMPYAENLTVKIATDPEGATIEEKELKPAPGVSLYTVGGATWFEWRGGAETETVMPDFLTLLKPGAKVLAPDPGGEGLLRRESGERLVPIFSQPLLPPGSASPGKVVSHPHVEIAEVTLPAAIAGKTIEAVAAGDAGIVVIVDGSAFALDTGERLHDPGPGLRSAAIASDGLFLLTRHSTCATLDGRKIVTGPAVTDPTIRAWAPRSGSPVYLHGGRFVQGLLIVTPQGPRELLPAYPPVTALGSTKDGVLVARGRTIEKMTVTDGKARLEPVLVLPDGAPVVGLHDAGGPLVIATEKGLYLLSDTLVLPIAEGVGGTLYPCKGGVLLHDRASRRLFRVQSPLFRES